MTFKKIPQTNYEISADGLCRRRKNGRVTYRRLSTSLSLTIYRNGKLYRSASVNTFLAELHPEAPRLTKDDAARINAQVEQLNAKAPQVRKLKAVPGMMSKRRCAKCKTPTYGYWCDECRAAHYAEGAEEYGSPLNEYQLPW